MLFLTNLILVPLLIIYVLDTAAQNYKDRFIDQARSDAQWIHSLLETSSSRSDAQTLMEELVLNAFRQSIQLLDAQNIQLAGAGIALDSPITNLNEDFRFGQHEDHLYWISLPLHKTGTDITSTLRLAYDETPIVEDINKLYARSLQLAFLYLVLIAVAVTGFSRYLAVSLNQLRKAAHRIATGDHDEQFLPRSRTTEIVGLSNDLEHMRQQLLERSNRLSEQTQHLRSLLDQIAEGVVTFEDDGTIVTCNPAALTLFACQSGIPANLRITDWLPDLQIPRWSENGSYPSVQTHLNQKQTDELMTIEMTVSPIKHKDQQQFLGLIRNISERKRIEDERRQHFDGLAHARRLSSLGEMAAELAHELNQPLAAINLYIQGCLKRLENSSAYPSEITVAIKKASLQAQRAGEIISQIRSFVKKATPKLRKTDLNQLITETVQLLEKELATVQVEFRLDKNLPTLNIDRLQIQQALINLITNGVDSMQTIPAEGRQLTLRTEQHDHDVTIAIEDCGHGVAKNISNQLFSAFASNKESGLGLGLAISRTIAEEHNGKLDFRRRTKEGTIFTLTLPITDKNAQTDEHHT